MQLTVHFRGIASKFHSQVESAFYAKHTVQYYTVCTSSPISSAFKRFAPRALRSASVTRFDIISFSSLSSLLSLSSIDDSEIELLCFKSSTSVTCCLAGKDKLVSGRSSRFFLHLSVKVIENFKSHVLLSSDKHQPSILFL